MKTIAVTSRFFDIEPINLAGMPEKIVKGSRNLFPVLPQAFGRVRRIGVLGWSSQGPAQACNLRDSLKGTDLTVTVGLREGSTSRAAAEAAGFRQADGTLGEMYRVIQESDLVLLLIADAAQVAHFDEILSAMKPGAVLGFSHGFLLGHLNSTGQTFRPDIDVIAVCPKGMGRSVRRLYEQGKEVNGAGINCSVAIQQDVSGEAGDIALAWAVAIGAPYIFFTTLESEYKSDIFGERGILLGAVHGLVESLYNWMRNAGLNREAAFRNSSKSITSTISRTISRHGLLGVYAALSEEEKPRFERAYTAAVGPARALLEEIYDEVALGMEIESVIAAQSRMERYPISKIGTTELWNTAHNFRGNADVPIHPETAGFYIAIMTAQCNVLRDRGHSYSEIVNESIIEAVDSLNPYMDHRGVAFMVDNCSTTARLGARKWAPRFGYVIDQEVLPALDTNHPQNLFKAFLNDPLHDALATCLNYRPSVNIAILD